MATVSPTLNAVSGMQYRWPASYVSVARGFISAPNLGSYPAGTSEASCVSRQTPFGNTRTPARFLTQCRRNASTEWDSPSTPRSGPRADERHAARAVATAGARSAYPGVFDRPPGPVRVPQPRRAADKSTSGRSRSSPAPAYLDRDRLQALRQGRTAPYPDRERHPSHPGGP